MTDAQDSRLDPRPNRQIGSSLSPNGNNCRRQAIRRADESADNFGWTGIVADDWVEAATARGMRECPI
jgi:hypothetical protein